MKPSHLKHQNGMAVVSAMLFAALTTVIVGQLIWQQQLLLSELENQQNATQATIVADAAIQWARAILAEDANSSTVDYNKEVWATRLPNTRAEGGIISGQIIDAQQFINLNSLASDEASRLGYARLLKALNLPSNLLSPVIDWQDADDITYDVDGAERMYYRAQESAYLAANQPFTEIGNLIRVKGYDKSSIDKLAPFITTLPQKTTVNVNTASAELLSFILPDVSLQDAQNIVAARNVAYFQTLDDFKSRLPNKNINVANLNLSVSSQYFLVTCIAQFGRTTLKIESLLYRSPSGWPIVIWKRIG